MGSTKSDAHELAHRRNQVAELSLQGLPQIAIAQELGISQPTVCRDLKALHQQWRDSGLRDFEEAVAIELEKLGRLERESWSAWQRSQAPQESTKVTQADSGKKAEKRVAHHYGDPRFLELVHRCIASRRALLGLDAPTKISPTSPDGEQSYHAHVVMELMRMAEEARSPQVVDGAYLEQLLRESIEQNDHDTPTEKDKP